MKIALIIILIVTILLIGVISYYGGFKHVEVSVKEEGGELLVYEELTGAYKNSGKLMDKIYYKLLNEDKIATTKGFGIYYDDPGKVEESKLRSEAGCILEDKDTNKVHALKEKYNIRKCAVKKYIWAEFPYKGKASVIFSLMKVYPALKGYAKEHGYYEDGAVMEIYDIPNNRIVYRKDISK